MTKMVIITDAWDEASARLRTPLVGSSGIELARMLYQVGFPCENLIHNFSSAYRMLRYWDNFPHQILSVFNERPVEDNIENFFASPHDKLPIDKAFNAYRFNNTNTYLRSEYSHHIKTLHAALTALKPNLIVALGNTALWALGLTPSIGKLRGNIVQSHFGKVLPTYHPASIMRKWSNRTIMLFDLLKAKREREFAAVATMEREIWTEPTIDDLYQWWEQHGSKSDLIAVDIETLRNQQIAEVGFAADAQHALHIPFVYKDHGQFRSWWPNTVTEAKAWEFVKMVCESDTPKIGQNVVQYDAYWLLHDLGIQLRNVTHDTMTLAHAWQPELEKGLGFLGSLFLDELSWKSIRRDTTKQND